MIIVLLAILGLCLGSFINALVWRIHMQLRSKKPSTKYSILKGHSMCPHCKHRLSASDLIPVLSWLELRGRCRYCRAKIGWQYPAVELLIAGLVVISYWQWPYSFSVAGTAVFGCWLACLVLLVALAVYDIRWMLLPDRLVAPVTIAAAVLAATLSFEHAQPNYLIWPTLGALFLSGLFWAIFQISDGKWIGGGDVKLAIALGLIAGGLLNSLLLLFIASLLGSLVSIPLITMSKRASHKIPFGPFLITAAIIVFLWGADTIGWYMQIIEV